MKRIRCRRPGIVTHIELLPKGNKLLRCLADKFLLGHAFPLRGLLHLLTVLIHSGQKEGRLSFQPSIAGDDVSEDLLVRVPDVRRGVGVVDRGRDKE